MSQIILEASRRRRSAAAGRRLPMNGIAEIFETTEPVGGRAEPAELRTTARERRVLHRLDKTAIGQRQADGTVSIGRTEPPDCVLFGPFWRLLAGRYELSFRCTAERPRFADMPVLGVEVVAFGLDQRAWADFNAAELRAGEASIEFEVPPLLAIEAGEDVPFEFRFLHLGNADLRLTEVRLIQLDAPDARPLPLPCWRLLGRLQSNSLACRDPSGNVNVSRWAPAGVILQGGRPYLRLGEGRYRLTLGGRAGRMRSGDRPVVAVEVSGRPGAIRSEGARERRDTVSIASARFTAQALANATAFIEFAIPLALSLEGGEDVPIEFRVSRLGRAALRIDRFELRRLEDGEAASIEVTPNVLGTRSGEPMRPRRNVLVIGNCQAETIHQAFQRAESLRRRFNARCQFVRLQKSLHRHGVEQLRQSDLLLVQDITDWQHYPLREHIPEGIEIVTFPLLRFTSLWPFDHYNGPVDREAYDSEWPNLTFLYQDGLLGRLRREIPDKEARFEAYRSLELDGIVNYRRLHDFERRRLLAMDNRFGCEIGRAVLDGFENERVFYTTNHPNLRILTLLMEWLMRKLGIEEPFSDIPQLDHLRLRQVPVHPKVAQTLGVIWANERTEYLYEGGMVTWEHYIRRYIEHYG